MSFMNRWPFLRVPEVAFVGDSGAFRAYPSWMRSSADILFVALERTTRKACWDFSCVLISGSIIWVVLLKVGRGG